MNHLLTQETRVSYPILSIRQVNAPNISSRSYTYLAANLDFALNFSPKKYRIYTPALHPTVKPARSVLPLSTPRLWNIG